MFDGGNCVSNALDFCLHLKKEPRNTVNKIIAEYHSQLQAHNGSGFDTWIVLNSFLVMNTLLILIKMVKE